MTERKLKTTYSLTTETDFRTEFSFLLQHGVRFKYVAPVRWYQFWRWRQVFTEDYLLSRADEAIFAQKMAGYVKTEIDEDLYRKVTIEGEQTDD